MTLLHICLTQVIRTGYVVGQLGWLHFELDGVSRVVALQVRLVQQAMSAAWVAVQLPVKGSDT